MRPPKWGFALSGSPADDEQLTVAGRWPVVGADRSREQAVAETFVVLADSLVEDFDVVDLLDELVTACVKLLGVTAGGLLLFDQGANLIVLASSTEETRLLEIFQLQNNEGPCLESARTGAVVLSDDLAGERGRWPGFVPAALEAGFGSVVAVPMRLREQTIGCLNLFYAQTLAMSADDQRVAQAFADVATIAILQHRLVARGAIVAEQLQNAVTSRVVIEQAKGMVAERHNIGMQEAFDALRRYARSHNEKLTDVANAVIHNQLEPDMIHLDRPAS